MFFALYFILLRFSLLRSNFLRHMRFIMSTKQLCLILRSNGESQAREGDRLTSINHGLRSVSIRMSNPRSSKQLFLELSFLSWDWMGLSTAINPFRMTSYILDQRRSLSIPICSICLFKAVRLHLWPSSPTSAFWFYTNLSLFLLME